jgi:hypothetical protein
MPGRYVDQLRQMTRAHGGGPSPEPGGAPPEDQPPPRSRRGLLLALVLLVLLAGGGWLLVRQLMADSKLQDCVMSGRKNCAPASP